MSESLDEEFIDDFIWLNTKGFNKDLKYRFNKLTEITSHAYEEVLSPQYSRNFFLSDNIVKLVRSDKKIGSTGDLSIITKWQKNISDKYYTSLLPGTSETLFEFERNREFFENLLSTKIGLKNPKKERVKKFKINHPSQAIKIDDLYSLKLSDMKKFINSIDQKLLLSVKGRKTKKILVPILWGLKNIVNKC